jgi:serpin B
MYNCMVFCLFILVGSLANAQTINVCGKVVNNVGVPISGAIVSLVHQGLKDTTGPDGVYSFSKNTAVKLPSLPPANEQISLKRGTLELSLTHPSLVKIEIFDVKGILLEKRFLQKTGAGLYCLNIAKNCRAANLFLIHVSTGSREITFPYLSLNTGKYTVNSSVESPSPIGGKLAKIAVSDIIDTLKATAPGYSANAVVISYYYWAADYMVVNLTLNKMDMRLLRSDVPQNRPNIASDQLKSLVNSNTLFAFELFKNLRTSGNNLFFSPYSISEAMAMIYGGAKNETSVQMANVLRFTMPDSIVHAGFDSLDRSMAARAAMDGSYTLNNAHSIWIQESLSIQKDFLDLLAAYYNTGLYRVDFTKAHDSSTIAINNWMSEMTAERINNLLPQDALTSLTRLVLVNTMYFKSMWNDTFSVADTRDSAFFNLDSTTSTVPFMHKKMYDEQYYETDRYQAAELMLAEWRTSMVIVMPKPGYFNAVENEFTIDTLYGIFSNFSSASLTLSMPKFSFETGSYDLKSILSSLGMQDAFKFETADFSGIDGKKDLFIGSVYHKGYISVNEWGVEAAAATSARIMKVGIEPNKIMSIDHPFILFIRDRWTKSVLFMGRIVKL